MRKRVSRRDAIKQIGAASAGFVVAGSGSFQRATTIGPLVSIAGSLVEIVVSSLSPETVRIVIRPIDGDTPRPVAVTGALDERPNFDRAVGQVTSTTPPTRIRAGN